MKKIFAFLLAAVGLTAAATASSACMILLLDEPEMPESLIK